MNVSDEITSIYKGKISLAEAMKEIDAVKKAFEIIGRIETRLGIQDDAIKDLQEKSDMYASYGFVMSKGEEAKQSVIKIIKEKFEEFTANFFTHLNEKLNRSEIDNFISNKCTWTAFNSLTQNVGSLKSRLDKHIFSDFEGLKTKMKVRFGDKHAEIINENAKIKEEFSQIKMRMSVVEQKINEMFVDDGLGDSEDYDSQEENDNIMQNLNNKDSLESDEEDHKADSAKPNITVIEPRRDSLLSKEPKPILQESDPIQVLVPESKPAEERKSLELVKPFPMTTNIPKQEFPVVQEKPLQTPNPILITPINSDPPKLEPIPQSISITKPAQDLKIPTSVVTPKASQPEPPKPPGSDHGSASKNNVLEIPDRTSYRKKDDDTSSRNKRNSSTGEPPILSRKNSMCSSVGYGGAGGGVGGGLRGLNKKFNSLQKDLETFKGLIDENKISIEEIRGEFGKVYDKIASVRMRCEEIEVNRQNMEQSFIKALRRCGKDKKAPVKQQGNAIDSKDLKKIYEMMNEKTTKLTVFEVQMERLSQDMEFVKGSYKEKINDIINSLRGLDNFRKESVKDSTDASHKISMIDEKINSLNCILNKELQNIKGPMTDLISDQQREKEILEENLKRQQATFRDIVDECSFSMKNIIPENIVQSRIGTARPNTRKANESPRVSVKHKFYDSNNAYRVSNPNVKADENWLTFYPDGRTIALPKVGVKKSEKCLTQELRKSTEYEARKAL